MVTVTGPAVADAYAAAAAVVDPEITVITIADLGVLREVAAGPDGSIIVTITPTYSGCPAMDVIRSEVAAAVRAAGYPDVLVRTVYRPAWSTDMITEAGREKLRLAGIAPPGPVSAAVAAPAGARHLPLLLDGHPAAPDCPRCGGGDVEEISRFGSTACKALWRCNRCSEPFEHIKAF
jgi:ring-1,2-phenylacetyl-CoA epoxidase subunit PaaD